MNNFKLFLEGILAAILGFFSYGALMSGVVDLLDSSSIQDWFFLTVSPLILIAGILLAIQPLYFVWKIGRKVFNK